MSALKDSSCVSNAFMNMAIGDLDAQNDGGASNGRL
jgi:hypothetical protein